MRQGRTLIVEAVAAVDAPRAEALRAEFVPVAEEPEARGEEALRLERERTQKLLAQQTTTLSEGAVVIGDGLYNNFTTLEQVDQAGARPCFSGLKAERVSDAFDYEAGADQQVCPEGQRSIGKARSRPGNGPRCGWTMATSTTSRPATARSVRAGASA